LTGVVVNRSMWNDHLFLLSDMRAPARLLISFRVWPSFSRRALIGQRRYFRPIWSEVLTQFSC
jgi:hypothetical protein